MKKNVVHNIVRIHYTLYTYITCYIIIYIIYIIIVLVYIPPCVRTAMFLIVLHIFLKVYRYDCIHLFNYFLGDLIYIILSEMMKIQLQLYIS